MFVLKITVLGADIMPIYFTMSQLLFLMTNCIPTDDQNLLFRDLRRNNIFFRVLKRDKSEL